jgi:hypothetical protein
MKISTLNKKYIRTLSLNSLILLLDMLFFDVTTEDGVPDQYNYTIGRFPRGWEFRVVHNWHKWSDLNLNHAFSLYQEPEYAIIAFLDYCIDNKIEPSNLTPSPEKTNLNPSN